MRRDKWVLVILIVIIGLVVVLRPYYGWWLKNVALPPLVGYSGGQTELANENVVLKAEVAELQSVKASLGTPPPGSAAAVVFSRYPFNFREEVLISAGRNEGVAEEGQPVLYKGILLGKVERAFPDTALVMTIFDSRFTLAVRVGQDAADALLQGGTTPTVALIPKKANVAPGDAVYSAAPGVPYGIPLGELGAVSVSGNQLFLQAPLVLSYSLNDVIAVWVLENVASQ